MASKFINENVKDEESAIEGAKYIIAEWISDNASFRKYIRNNMYKYVVLESSLKKHAKDEGKVYEMYYEYSEPVSKIKPHRILAINRGEKEDVLTVKINVDKEHIVEFLKEEKY